MLPDASSVRDEFEFRFYFPNATGSFPYDYSIARPLDFNRTMLIVIYSIIFTAGLISNFWVAHVVGSVLRESRTEAPRAVQIFILALCSCDVFILAFASMLLADLWYGEWSVRFGLLCRLYLASESLSKFYAPFLLVVLSAVCYFSVKSHNGSRLAKKNVAIIAVLLCLGAAFLLITPVYWYSDVVYLILHINQTIVLGIMTKCVFQAPETVTSFFTAYSFLVGYLIPACSFTYFYAALLWHVHRRRRVSSVATEKSFDYFSRVAKTSCGLVVFYLVSWTPYWAMTVYMYFWPVQDGHSNALVILSYFFHMLPYLNCTAFPLLYTILNRSIKCDYSRAREKRRSLRQRKSDSRKVSSSFARSSFLDSVRSSTKVTTTTDIKNENPEENEIHVLIEIESSDVRRKWRLRKSANGKRRFCTRDKRVAAIATYNAVDSMPKRENVRVMSNDEYV